MQSPLQCLSEGSAAPRALFCSVQGSFHPSQAQVWELGHCCDPIMALPGCGAATPSFLQLPVFYPNNAFPRKRSDYSPGL